MPKLDSLDSLLVHELQDIYDAERQILEVLPKMIRAASHPELQSALKKHLRQTEGQVERLEQACGLLGAPVRGKRCEGMAGLLEETNTIIEEDALPSVRDAALIAVAEKVENYEIVGYGCVCAYSEVLGYDQVHDLLRQNLDEEETADQRLLQLAETLMSPAEH